MSARNLVVILAWTAAMALVVCPCAGVAEACPWAHGAKSAAADAAPSLRGVKAPPCCGEADGCGLQRPAVSKSAPDDFGVLLVAGATARADDGDRLAAAASPLADHPQAPEKPPIFLRIRSLRI